MEQLVRKVQSRPQVFHLPSRTIENALAVIVPAVQNRSRAVEEADQVALMPEGVAHFASAELAVAPIAILNW